jgi:hypothetical protein
MGLLEKLGLTAEQKTKLEGLKQERKEKMEQRMKKVMLYWGKVMLILQPL